MTRHILAIDLGTSALKVALVSTAGEVAAAEQDTCQVRLLPGGGAEQDPEQWWDLITAASSRLMTRAGVPAESVVAVACTAQWSGTVPVDERCQPLRDAIIWMDSRGAPYVQRITRGAVNVQGYGVGKLARWLRTTAGIPAPQRQGLDRPHPVAQARGAGDLPADAPVPGAQGLAERPPHRPAGGIVRLDRAALGDRQPPSGPDPVRPGAAAAGRDRAVAAAGTAGRHGHPRPAAAGPAGALGVPAGIPVVVGSPDLQSAAIGAGATRDFQAHLYVGTSSWLTCHVPFKRTDLRHNMASLPSPVPQRYFVADEQETAGAALTFLRDRVLFGGDPPACAYAEFDRMAAQAPPGSHGVIFTPWLYGERTPVEDRFVRGGFHNLSLSASRDDLVRAVFEGVALNARWLLQAVERFSRHRLEPIRFIGGGARSDVWCQIFADVLGRAIEQVADPVNANARGAGLLAAVALGELTFSQVPERVKVAGTYQPEPATRELYDELFTEFVGFYRRNRRAHARLNRRAG